MSRLSRRRRSASLCTIIAVAATVATTSCARRAASAPAGCGRAIPESQLWAESSDVETDRALADAERCAGSRGTHVLVEFVAPWCEDCREMTRLDRVPEVASVIRERYEHVRVNVGRWDQHTAMLRRFGVDRIAAYVVLDAHGRRIAQTVLEPITGGHGPVTAAQWIAWLRAPH
jgi:thiol:disulfide interchange protein